MQAHRGVSTDAPENTLAAYRLAVAQGYDLIELDPKMTKDGVPILLHDNTLNRTARLRGAVLEKPLSSRELTLSELSAYDVGEWFSEEFRGERIPTLAEVLAFAEEVGMELKIDNVIFTFSPEEREIVYALLRESGAKAGITASTEENLMEAARAVPLAPLHYDGEVSEELLLRLREALPERGLPFGRDSRTSLAYGARSHPLPKRPLPW